MLLTIRSVFITTKKHGLNTSLIMNVVYLKVMCGRCVHLFPFFSVRRWGGILSINYHHLHSATNMRCERRAREWRGMSFFFLFEQLGWNTPNPPPPPPKLRTMHIVSLISRRPDRKGTLARARQWTHKSLTFKPSSWALVNTEFTDLLEHDISPEQC